MSDIYSVLCISYLCSFYIFIIQYFKLEYKLLFFRRIAHCRKSCTYG